MGTMLRLVVATLLAVGCAEATYKFDEAPCPAAPAATPDSSVVLQLPLVMSDHKVDGQLWHLAPDGVAHADGAQFPVLRPTTKARLFLDVGNARCVSTDPCVVTVSLARNHDIGTPPLVSFTSVFDGTADSGEVEASFSAGDLASVVITAVSGEMSLRVSGELYLYN